MSSERYSKLQKWIIEQLYRITIMRDFSVLENSEIIDCQYYNTESCKKEEFILSRDNYNIVILTPKCRKHNHCDSLEYFTNDNILIGYFGFTTRKHKYCVDKKIVTDVNSKDVNKARVTISRSIKSLKDKGIIAIYGYSPFLNYKLTDLGIRKAEQLLNLEPHDLPELNVNKCAENG